MFTVNRKDIEEIIKVNGYVEAIRVVRKHGYSFTTARAIVKEISDAIQVVKTKPISAVRVYCAHVTDPTNTSDRVPAMMVNIERIYKTSGRYKLSDNLTCRVSNRYFSISDASLRRLTNALNRSNPARVKIVLASIYVSTHFLYEQETEGE